MATLNFIRGTIRGKIGEFVGSSWKGKHYIKTFTKPGNPRTADQVAVRTVFYNVSQIAKAIYKNVLKPFTFPPPRRQTAYNRMIQINKPMFEAKEWNPEGLKIFEGPLHNPGITAAAITGDTLTVTHAATGGDAEDTAVAVVYDGAGGAVMGAADRRDKGSIDVSVSGIPTSARSDLHAYLVFSHAPDPANKEDKGDVSNTAYLKVTP